jgi:hypothetical protein
MDPSMQQFFQTQTQLLENLTNTVANLQAQVTNHSSMSHRPPVFTHAADPLEANDRLKTVGKMLTTTQCDDREKVLFAAGQLQGTAGAWWDAYVVAYAMPDAATWQEFTNNFRSHHIPQG